MQNLILEIQKELQIAENEHERAAAVVAELFETSRKGILHDENFTRVAFSNQTNTYIRAQGLKSILERAISLNNN